MVVRQVRCGIYLDPDELPSISLMSEVPETWQGDTVPFRNTCPPLLWARSVS